MVKREEAFWIFEYTARGGKDAEREKERENLTEREIKREGERTEESGTRGRGESARELPAGPNPMCVCVGERERERDSK